MTERPPYPTLAPEVAIFVLARNAWAFESCGSLESRLGWTAWLSNSPAEIPEIAAAFAPEFEQIGLTDPRQLIGHWLVDLTGINVDVLSFETEDEVQAAYKRIEELHDRMEA